MHHIRNRLIGALVVVFLVAMALSIITSALAHLWPVLLMATVLVAIVAEIIKRVFQ